MSKSDALAGLSYKAYFNSEFDKAIDLQQEALKICIENNLTKGEAAAHSNLGTFFEVTGSKDMALEHYEKCLKIREVLNDKELLAQSLNNIGNFFLNIAETNKGLTYLLRAKELNPKDGAILNNIGFAYETIGDYYRALDTYKAGLELSRLNNDKPAMAAAYNNIAGAYQSSGNIPSALENYFQALAIREALGTKSELPSTLVGIGVLYETQENFDKAMEYYKKSLKIGEESAGQIDMTVTYNNIAGIYNKKKEFEKAIEYYKKSKASAEGRNDKSNIAHALSNLGIVCLQSDFNEALKYSLESLNISKEINEKFGIARSLISVGSVYRKLKEYKKSEDFLLEAVTIAKEINQKVFIKNSYEQLKMLYNEKGDYKNGIKYLELFMQAKDSLNNDANHKKILGSQFKYEYEKKALADSLKIAEDKKLTSMQLKQEKTQRFALYGGLFLVVLFAGFMFNRFRVTQKQKNIIELKEKETQIQKHIIEEKHKEITDSINYAERIQKSFIATKEILDENLNDYFVLFKPKDVVSGDFYWASKLNNGNFALATADSTGHGVPGAIMSLLNITSLEKAIETEIEPSQILNITRKIIVDRLKKDGSPEGGKDGMDCSITVYDFKKNKLIIAAANNPVWIVRGQDTIDIKPDKMPVGKHDRDSVTFTQQEIELQKGDLVYTLTDGFPDQFGGEKGKKFMSKNLRELLSANAHLPMKEQKELLELTFKKWVGNLEQVDDVCLIGVRV
jgi:serine phosphatase RsbU (regulator of sigma subunit)/Flp pilus assembly protein TadD